MTDVTLGKPAKAEKGSVTYRVKGADGQLMGAVVGERVDNPLPVFKVTAFAAIDPKNPTKTLPPEKLETSLQFGLNAPDHSLDFTDVMKDIRGKTNPVEVSVTGIKVSGAAYDRKPLAKDDKISITVEAGSGKTKHDFTLLGTVIDDPAAQQSKKGFVTSNPTKTNPRIRITEMITPEGNKIILGGTAKNAVANPGVILRESDLKNADSLKMALKQPPEGRVNPFQEAFMEYASQKGGHTVATMDSKFGSNTLAAIAADGSMLRELFSNIQHMVESALGGFQPNAVAHKDGASRDKGGIG